MCIYKRMGIWIGRPRVSTRTGPRAKLTGRDNYEQVFGNIRALNLDGWKAQYMEFLEEME